MTDHELIAALCLRIGMIMEDVCGEAVTAQAGDREQLAGVVAQLQAATTQIGALVAAATKLIEACNFTSA